MLLVMDVELLQLIHVYSLKSKQNQLKSFPRANSWSSTTHIQTGLLKLDNDIQEISWKGDVEIEKGIC